jgi:pilus assembly protein CpaF
MTKRGEPLPINQALNRPRAKLGLDLTAWMSTIHAKSAVDALNRLSNLALSARPNLNHAFMRSETAQAIDFVLYCERDHTGRRRVRELITVAGYSHADQCFQTEDIYRASAA